MTLSNFEDKLAACRNVEDLERLYSLLCRVTPVTQRKVFFDLLYVKEEALLREDDVARDFYSRQP
ncbi:hypothetical protein SG64_22720 [Enterobacter hormaechei subsp. xiangfangensis]|nr:hypothetical protein SG64_22720 [Enterobacter hormaechei subsp. xiangfangensis]